MKEESDVGHIHEKRTSWKERWNMVMQYQLFIQIGGILFLGLIAGSIMHSIRFQAWLQFRIAPLFAPVIEWGQENLSIMLVSGVALIWAILSLLNMIRR